MTWKFRPLLKPPPLSESLGSTEPPPLSESLGSTEPPPLSESLGFPEPPPLSESLGSSKPQTLSETLAYSMPVARSIFVPTTPGQPAHIGHTYLVTDSAIVSHFCAFNSFICDATGGF